MKGGGDGEGWPNKAFRIGAGIKWGQSGKIRCPVNALLWSDGFTETP